MELDTELIDVSGNLGPLRFVFLELMLKFGNPDCRLRGYLDVARRHGDWRSAFLTGYRHPGRGSIYNEGSSTTGTSEQDIAWRQYSFEGLAGYRRHRRKG